MKNNWGWGGGLNREGGLINFLPLKRGGLLEGGGLFERGGLIEDLRYMRVSDSGHRKNPLPVIKKHISFRDKRNCRLVIT